MLSLLFIVHTAFLHTNQPHVFKFLSLFDRPVILFHLLSLHCVALLLIIFTWMIVHFLILLLYGTLLENFAKQVVILLLHLLVVFLYFLLNFVLSSTFHLHSFLASILYCMYVWTDSCMSFVSSPLSFPLYHGVLFMFCLSDWLLHAL